MSRLPGENKKKSYYNFFELLPFANFGIKTCNNDIFKTITASSFKLGQLIENDKEITW